MANFGDLPLDIYVLLAKQLAPRDAGALFQVSHTLARVKREYFGAATQAYARGVKNIVESYKLYVKDKQGYHFYLQLLLEGLDNGMDEEIMSFEVIPMRWVVGAFVFFGDRYLVMRKVTKPFWNSSIPDEIRTLLVMYDMINLKKVVCQNRIMCLELVQWNPKLIKHCRFQTPQVRAAALGYDITLIRYLNEPTDDEFKLVLDAESEDEIHYYNWFENLKTQPDWVSERILSSNCEELKYVHIQTYELCMVAIRALVSEDDSLTPGNLFRDALWNDIRDPNIRERIEYEICEELLARKRIKL